MARRRPQLAKLTCPRVHRPLLRERLFAELDSIKEYPVFWIAGPAGSGKTTLVASYLKQQRIRTCWYQVDEIDRDPASMFFYLGEMAKQIEGKRHRPLPLFTAEYFASLSGFARRFFRDLFSRMHLGDVLVFDNLHLAAGPVLDTILIEASKEIPIGVSLIAISRTDMPAGLVGSLTNERVRYLGWDSLKLDAEEVRSIARAERIQDSGTLQALPAQSGGWAAGLKLMISAPRGAKVSPFGISLASMEAIFNYFAGEVFDSSDPHIQETLLDLSSFSAFSHSLAKALIPDQDTSAILERLYRMHYFIERRETDESFYEFHPLFRQFLRTRHLLRPTEKVRNVGTKAAALLIAHGQAEAAIQLLLENQQWNQIVEILGSHGEMMLRQGRWQTIQSWISQVPDGVQRSTPWFSFWIGASRLHIDPAAAVEDFTKAHRAFSTHQDVTGQCMCASMILMAYYFRMDSFRPMDPWIDVLEVLVGELDIPAAHPIRMRALAALLLASILRRPKHSRIGEWAQDVSNFLQEDSDPAERFTAALVLVQYAGLSGDTTRGQVARTFLNECLLSGGIPPIGKSFALNYSGYFEFVRGDGLTALSLLSQSTSIASQENLLVCSQQAAYFSILIRSAWKQVPQVDTLHARLKGDGTAPPAVLLLQFHIATAKFRSLHGELDDAIAAAQDAVTCSDSIGLDYLSFLSRALLAIYLIRQGERKSVNDLLLEMDGYCDSGALQVMAPLVLLIRAEYWLSVDNKSDATNALQKVSRAASASGWVSLPCCPVDELSHCVAFALKSDIGTEFWKQMISVQRLPPPKNRPADWPYSIRIRTLGRFSIEVNGVPVTFGRKAPRKALHLLKLIVASGNRHISEVTVNETLWPDAEGDGQSNALKQTLHRLRSMLCDRDAVKVSDGLIHLNSEKVWIDVEALRSLFVEPPNNKDALLQTALELSRIYSGDFLEEEVDEPIFDRSRKEYKNGFVRKLCEIASRLDELHFPEAAREIYGKALRVDNSSISARQGAREQGLN